MKKQVVALCLFLIISVCLFGCQLTEKPIEAPIENGEQISNNTELPSGQDVQTEVDAVSEQTEVNETEKEDETVPEITEEPEIPVEEETESVQIITEETESETETIEENNEPEPEVETEPQIIECSGIALSQQSLSLTEGEAAVITATVTPDNATDRTVKWSTSDKTVATVSNGTITAVGKGSAKITAETSNGKKAEITVEVKAKIIDAEKITVSQSSLSLTEGEAAVITATVTPDNATDRSVKWSTSDKTVATVSNGTVTAVGNGSAKITAETSNGKKAEVTVEVKTKIIDAEKITVSQSSLSLTEGEAAVITATVTPDNATDRSVKWSTSDKTVATVSNGTITAVGNGNAKIIAETSNGKKTEISVEVKAKVIAPMSDSVSFYYYSLLNSSEKLLYDALLDGAVNGLTEISELGQYKITVDSINKIIDFFRMDQVELFNLSDSVSYYYDSDNFVSSVMFSYIMDTETYNAAVAELEKAADNLKTQARKLSTETERVLIAYDFVKNHFIYGGTSGRAYNMYYAYKDGYGVCEAYSKLFGYLLSKIGIESIQVNGFGHDESHRWVMAKIDGKWYHFDPTWDDPIGNTDEFLYYNYFAVTDNRILLDHQIDNPELLPKADSSDANYFVANGLVLEGTGDGEFESIAQKAYALTGHIIFSCTDSVYNYITSNGDCLWTFVRAVSPSSKSISFVNNDISKVIQIIFQ